MNKIRYFLYWEPLDLCWGVNAYKTTSPTENGAYMYCRTNDDQARDTWYFPGMGCTQRDIQEHAQKNSGEKGYKFVNACAIRRLFKEHGIELDVMPAESTDE